MFIYSSLPYRNAPNDIGKALIDTGGKEFVIKKANSDETVLHWACHSGASHNILKMLIDVGGKDLVMAKNNNGDTALHHFCRFIKTHTKAAEIINIMLQVSDANLLLSAKKG